MRNIVLCFVMTLFFVNTVAVSAWSAPCMKQAGVEFSQDMNANMDGESPPCHDEQKSSQDHCKGLCLCFHATIHQTPVLNTLAISHPEISKERIAALDDDAASLSPSPALRPPIHTS